MPGEIDWRHVSWGGVLIDDRPFGKTDQACNCIPAADNPPVTSAEEAGLAYVTPEVGEAVDVFAPRPSTGWWRL